MNVTVLQPLSNRVDEEREWLLTSQKEAARHRTALDTSTQRGLTSSWQNKQTKKQKQGEKFQPQPSPASRAHYRCLETPGTEQP